MSTYLERITALSSQVFEGKDKQLSENFIKSRRFTDLYDLTKAEKTKEAKKEENIGAEVISSRLANLETLEGELAIYLDLTGDFNIQDAYEEY